MEALKELPSVRVVSYTKYETWIRTREGPTAQVFRQQTIRVFYQLDVDWLTAKKKKKLGL